MKSKLEYINLFIAFIIGYLYQCMSSDKLIFIDWFVKDTAFNSVKNWSWLILLILGLIYLIVFIVIKVRVESKEEKKQYCKLSRYLFNKIDESCEGLDKSAYRVTIFKARKVHKEKPKLVAVGRYQKRMPKVNTKIRFNGNEGCVGMCFTTQQIVSKKIDEYDHANPNKWFIQCEKELKLPKKKAVKTHLKACTFLCLPLISLDTEQTWGVVVIDSIQHTNEFEQKSRIFESIIANYAFIFSVGEN